MNLKLTTGVFAASVLIGACGTTPDGYENPGNGAATPDSSINRPVNRDVVDPLPDCAASFCGNERFRSAIPTRRTVSIHFGASQQALGELSEAYLAAGDHIAEINDTIDEVFVTIEDLAAGEPVVAEDHLHVWREEIDGVEIVLQITSDDSVLYELALDAVAVGTDLTEANVGFTGAVVLDDLGDKEQFEFHIAYDEFGFEFEDDYSGDFIVTAVPFDDGLWQVTYDLSEVDGTGANAETTTYWVLGDTAGALEYTYVGFDHDVEVTNEASVAWDDFGGRWDGLAVGYHPDYGEFEAIGTQCWDSIGGLTFAGEAFFSDAETYGDVDGSEDGCAFDMSIHPDLDDDFVAYFDDAGWASIEVDAPNDPTDVDREDTDSSGAVSDADCLDAAQRIADEIEFCGFELYDSDLPENRCTDDTGKAAACAELLASSDDPCYELQFEPDCL